MIPSDTDPSRPPSAVSRRHVVCCLIALHFGLALSPTDAQECAYVGNQLVGIVRILEIPGGREVDSTTLPDCSLGICQLTDISVHAMTGEIFVSQLDGDRVWVVDPREDTEPSMISLASAPTDMVVAPDGSPLYVISAGTQEAVSITPSTKTEDGRFGLPSQPRGLAITPDGSTLVTTSRDQNSVLMLNSSDGSVLRTGDTGERPVAVALSPSGDRAFAAAEDGTLTVIDVAAGSTLDTITVGMLPAAVAVHPDGQTVYVANRGDDTVSVVTVATGGVASITVGRSPIALAVTSDGLVLVANLQGGDLSIIDTNNGNTLLAPIVAGVSPSALAIATCPGTPSSCTGDCNNDGMTAINELITGVNINLGMRSIADCPAFDENNDGSVAISELIRGVRNSLDGCPS